MAVNNYSNNRQVGTTAVVPALPYNVLNNVLSPKRPVSNYVSTPKHTGLNYHHVGLSYDHTGLNTKHVDPNYRYNTANNYDTNNFWTKYVLDPRYLTNTTNRLAYNSLADVVFNYAAWQKRWGEDSWLNTWYGYIPRVLADTALLGWNTSYKPIIKNTLESINTAYNDVKSKNLLAVPGDILAGFTRSQTTATLNSLINLGNSLDFLGNPIKGYALEGTQGFVRGLVGDEYGRKQYDYIDYIDYGPGFWNGVAEFGTSLLLETLSDPLNWLSLGGKALLGTSTKSAATKTATTASRYVDDALRLGKNSVDDIADALLKSSKNITETTARAMAQNMVDTATGVITRESAEKVLKTYGKGLAGMSYKSILKEAGNVKKVNNSIAGIADGLKSGKLTRFKAGLFSKKLSLTPAIQMAISEELPNVVSTASKSIGTKLLRTSDIITKSVIKSALYTTPNPGYGALKLIVRAITNSKLSKIIKIGHSNNIIKTVEDLADDFKFTSEVPQVVENIGHASDLITNLKELTRIKDRWSSKLIDLVKNHTITKELLRKQNIQALSDINKVFINLGYNNIDEYIATLKSAVSFSKTDTKEVLTYIKRLQDYKMLFDTNVTDKILAQRIQQFTDYDAIINGILHNTESQNVNKIIKTATRVEQARSIVDTVFENAKTVLKENEALTNAITDITSKHDTFTSITEALKQAYGDTIAPTNRTINSTMVDSLVKDFKAYQQAYDEYYTILHLNVSERALLDAKYNLIQRYNTMYNNYKNIISPAAERVARITDTNLLALNKRVTSFINSVHSFDITRTDRLVNANYYIKYKAVSYTLMTNQTKTMHAMVGLALDGSIDKFTNNPMYKLLRSKTAIKKSLSTLPNDLQTDIKKLLDRLSIYRDIVINIKTICDKNNLPVGYTQGLLDALTGYCISGQIHKTVDYTELSKYLFNNADIYFIEQLGNKTPYKLTGELRELITVEVTDLFKNKHNSIVFSGIFSNGKLFSSVDARSLYRLSNVETNEQLSKLMKQVADDWYSPATFDTTKYFTISHLFDAVGTEFYTEALERTIKQGIDLGFINVPGTTDIMTALRRNASFDTVQLNFKRRISYSFTNVFDITKRYPNGIMPSDVLERLSEQAKSISRIKLLLQDSSITHCIKDADAFIALLKNNKVSGMSILENNIDMLLDNADAATRVAVAKYYIQNLTEQQIRQFNLFSFLNDPKILRISEYDPITKLPKTLYVDDVYTYTNRVNVNIKNPYKAFTAYNIEYSIHSINKATKHFLDSTDSAFAKIVDDCLDNNPCFNRKTLEGIIFKYQDYLDELAISNILERPDRVNAFKKEYFMRAGVVYFETNTPIDLTDFAKDSDIITKTLKTTDNNTIVYRHVIAAKRSVIDTAEEITTTVKINRSPELDRLMDQMRHTISNLKKHNANDTLIKPYVESLHKLEVLQDSLFEARTRVSKYINNVDYSHGEWFTREHLRGIYNILAQDFGIDVDELIDINTLESIGYFKKLRANNSVIGNYAVWKLFYNNTNLSYAADPFNQLFNVHAGAVFTQETQLASFANLFLNENNRYSTLSKTFFYKLSDADKFKLIKQSKDFGYGWYYLQKPNISKDTVLGRYFFNDQTKSGYILKKVPITNIKSLKALESVDAYLLPHTYAAQLMEAFNTYELPTVAAFANCLSKIYKIGYLGSPGLIIRNFIDSNYKTRVALDNTVELPEQIKHLFTSMDLLTKYNDINVVYSSKLHKLFETDLDYDVFYRVIKVLEDNSPDDVLTKVVSSYSDNLNNVVTNRVKHILKNFEVDELLSLNKKLIDPDMFSLIDPFIKHGPSAGIYTEVLNNIRVPVQGESQKIIDKILGAWVDKGPLRFLYTANEMVEQSARLSMFLLDLERGSSIDSAINAVIKTHFNYADKSLAMLYTEILFPFMNFTYKNVQFWIEQLSKNPWVFNELQHILRTSWNYQSLFSNNQEAYRSFDYSFDWDKDIIGLETSIPWEKVDAARIYHILTGNIIINLDKTVKHDKGYGKQDTNLAAVFKLSPSVLDAVKILSTPISATTERLLPPIEVVGNIISNMLNDKIDSNILSKSILASTLLNIPIIDSPLQRIGVDETGLKHNNVVTRIKDVGLIESIASLFGAVYETRNPNKAVYDAKFNNLAYKPKQRLKRITTHKFKSHTQHYNFNYTPYYDVNNPKVINLMPYRINQQSRNNPVIARHKYIDNHNKQLYDYQYNNLISNKSDAILKYRLRDNIHYY